jgi:hypothetical protein
VIMSHYPNSGQNKNIRTALTNQNDIHDEIKNKLNMRNARYHSVQNVFCLHVSDQKT